MFRFSPFSLKPETVYEQHFREIEIEEMELRNSCRNKTIIAIQRNTALERDEFDEEDGKWYSVYGEVKDPRAVTKAPDLTEA